jgi:hypothetical protein
LIYLFSPQQHRSAVRGFVPLWPILRKEALPMFANIFEVLVPLETETLKAVDVICGLGIVGDGTITHSV